MRRKPWRAPEEPAERKRKRHERMSLLLTRLDQLREVKRHVWTRNLALTQRELEMELAQCQYAHKKEEGELECL